MMEYIEQLDSPAAHHQNGHEQLEDLPIQERIVEVSTSKDKEDIEGEIGAGEESVVIVYS